MKKKKMKRIWAMMMAVSLVMGIPSAFPGITAKASGAEQELKVNQFATKEQLLSSFDLCDETEQKTAQKVYFGQNTSDAQTWYIAGQDTNGDLVLMCDLTKPLKEEQRFEESPEIWHEDIMELEVIKEKAYDSDSGCSYSGQSPEKVYINHYGSSELRKVLQSLEADSDYFSSGEQALMQETTITTKDEYNNTTYTTTDKLYLAHGDYAEYSYITVGADSGKTLKSGLKIGVETGLYVPEEWEAFWLRSPYPGPDYDDGGEHGRYVTAIFDGYEENMGMHNVGNVNIVLPAFNLDVSSVLFASAVPAVSSEGKLATDDALTFRYESAAPGSAVVSQAAGRISISNVPEQTYLVVQNSSGAWAKQVSQDGELSPQDISPDISSFEGCKVWLESTDKNRITTAAMADWRWDVKITPGSHMTKTEDSGAETQTGLSGAMTDVVYTANEGYYFPEDYPAAEQNGISVRRNDFTRITISGTPTGNVNIPLMAATAKEEQEEPQVSGGVMKINGTTAAMEYAGSKTAAVWDECTDDYTAVRAGTWYVRYKETDTRRAGQASEVEVIVAPRIIEGADGKWTKSSKNGLSFRSDADFREFLKVTVDGQEIRESDYTVREGSTIVTLKPEYLETLDGGKHTLGIVSAGGTAETTFTIEAKAAPADEQKPTADKHNPAAADNGTAVPQTGDGGNLFLWFAIFLLAAGGIIIAIVSRRKINSRQQV